MVPQYGSSDSGDSQSDSEEGGSSGSDSEVRRRLPPPLLPLPAASFPTYYMVVNRPSSITT